MLRLCFVLFLLLSACEQEGPNENPADTVFPQTNNRNNPHSVNANTESENDELDSEVTTYLEMIEGLEGQHEVMQYKTVLDIQQRLIARLEKIEQQGIQLPEAKIQKLQKLEQVIKDKMEELNQNDALVEAFKQIPEFQKMLEEQQKQINEMSDEEFNESLEGITTDDPDLQKLLDEGDELSNVMKGAEIVNVDFYEAWKQDDIEKEIKLSDWIIVATSSEGENYKEILAISQQTINNHKVIVTGDSTARVISLEKLAQRTEWQQEVKLQNLLKSGQEIGKVMIQAISAGLPFSDFWEQNPLSKKIDIQQWKMAEKQENNVIMQSKEVIHSKKVVIHADGTATIVLE